MKNKINIDKMRNTRINNGSYIKHGKKMKELASKGLLPNQTLEGRKRISKSLKNSIACKNKIQILKEKTANKYGFITHEKSVSTIGDLYYNKNMSKKDIQNKYNSSNSFINIRIKEYNILFNNHKVISVILSGKEDVYDFTVDSSHNFALSSGVFVHNCFGERQHPEKFIMKVIKAILNGEKIQIHSDKTKTIPGSRFWIHARNVADAIMFILENGEVRDKYNIVGEREVDNLEMALTIANIINMDLDYELIDFHSSRPGHDLRYALDGTKLKEMGFTFKKNFYESLKQTIEWTLENKKWLYGEEK